MARVRNISKETITTITAGNILPERVKDVADWEVPLIERLHGKKVEITATPAQPKKKGKK